ncbi:MAG: hypothetical protein AAF518_15325 [Spirochaetota bacterium]
MALVFNKKIILELLSKIDLELSEESNIYIIGGSASCIVQRFSEEILPLNPGNDQFLKDKYLSCIEHVFGDDVAEKHNTKL